MPRCLSRHANLCRQRGPHIILDLLNILELELDYKRQRWMWGKPLTKITINYTCDLQAPFSEHIVERTFLIHSRIVLAVFTRRTGQRYLLTFNDEGERMATIRLHADI